MSRISMNRTLLAVGVLAPVAFLVVLLVEGATRPGYSAWRMFGSNLATGPGGWMQIANFVICGVLVMAASVGLGRTTPQTRWGPRLVGVFGLSLVVAGAFVTDPGLGYPPGTPLKPSGPPSWHGAVHGFNALVCFGAVTAAALVYWRAFARDRHTRAWAIYSGLTGAASLLLFPAFLVANAMDQNGTWHDAPGGLLQRIAIALAWGWVSLVSLRSLRFPASVEQATAAAAAK
jgi:hypothetical protein